MGKRLRDTVWHQIKWNHERGANMPYRERYVLLALANELKDNPGGTWTSDAKIAEKLCMSPDAYYRARTKLIEWGFMERIEGGGQGSRFNRYSIVSSAATAEASSAGTAELGPVTRDATSAATPVSSAVTATDFRTYRGYNPEEPATNPSPYGCDNELPRPPKQVAEIFPFPEVEIMSPQHMIDGWYEVCPLDPYSMWRVSA